MQGDSSAADQRRQRGTGRARGGGTSGRPSAGRANALAEGTVAHYLDVRYYSATYADRTDDIGYYLGQALEHARGGRGSVLEYGCGNGRIALPLARAGLTVTGLDRSRTMLADLRQRLAAEPVAVRRRLQVRRGDMRRAKLGRRFDLVLCTFNTLLHLYTRQDVERFCARALRHMRRGARLILDVSLPDPDELGRNPERAYRVPRFRHPTTGEVVRYAERFDYHPLEQVLMVSMEFEPRDAPERRYLTPLAHRQFFPRELEALLHYNGLRVVEVHGDFTTDPPELDCETLIYHCRARSARRAAKRGGR